jgi:hypothetical protein
MVEIENLDHEASVLAVDPSSAILEKADTISSPSRALPMAMAESAEMIGMPPTESPRKSHQSHFRHPSAPSPPTSTSASEGHPSPARPPRPPGGQITNSSSTPKRNVDHLTTAQAITSPFQLTSPRQYTTPPSPRTVIVPEGLGVPDVPDVPEEDEGDEEA